MDPFVSIVRVVRHEDMLLAYNQAGTLVVELATEGLSDLLEMRPDITVESRDSREFDVAAVTSETVFLAKNASPKMVDGVYLQKGQYVLVLRQPDPAKNGIYVVYETADRDGAWWVLAGDQPVPGDRVNILGGHTQKGKVWTRVLQGWDARTT